MEMSKQKKENRTKRITFALTEEEHRKILYLCQKFDWSFSEAVRNSAMIMYERVTEAGLGK